MDISLTDPLTWVVVLVAPVLIVALRWSFRKRHRPPGGEDHPDDQTRTTRSE